MFIVYKTTNLLNGKIYIGVHGADNPDYLGSGVVLNKAIRKYGKQNFKRETLFEFDSLEEAFEKEAVLVNDGFIVRRDTYNLKLGGLGVSGMKGVNHSEATKNKMSKSHKNIKPITCPKCGTIGKPSPMKRWHFENCRGAVVKSIKPVGRPKKPCVYRGIEYCSISEAATALGISQPAMSKRMQKANLSA